MIIGRLCSAFSLGVPPAKRIKVGEGGSGRGEEGEEEEDEMEDGAGGLDIPTGTQVTAPVKSEVMETEKTAAMMRSGKTLEQRQDEFKDMLLERGVSVEQSFSSLSYMTCTFTQTTCTCILCCPSLCVHTGLGVLHLGQGAAQVCV